ncbi:MAG: LamG-like jellyroll fold domain-containing protein [Polyangiaceae bacterium]
MKYKAILLSGCASVGVLFAACSSDPASGNDAGASDGSVVQTDTGTGGDGGSNPCATTTCAADATCSVKNGAAACECKAGFSGDGKTCTKIANCAGNPCKNGATCTDGATGYTCKCAAGFSGTNCETNIDECAPNPCKNGGTCADGVGKFTCTCPAGFSGNTCETNIDECAPNPCKNGGTCADGVNKFTCTCAAGFSGTTCDTNIDECNPNPCMNGGTCADGVNQFTCTCINGFSGTKCDVAPYPTTNLMAYWNFEQAQGTVTDQSQNGNNAVNVTATRDNGRLGFGYTFAGAQCISFANSASLNMGGKAGFTGMLWEKYTIPGGGGGIFFNQENTYELAISQAGANILSDAIPYPAGWVWRGTKALTVNTWQHVALTWDGATTKHYVDGALVYTQAQGGTLSNNAGAGFGIGCRNVAANGSIGAIGQLFTGTIDEMFIYDRALTDQEIATYYNATKP